jgi:hypothetical protein
MAVASSCRRARTAASGPGWYECVIDAELAAASRSVSESVARGHSILVMPSLASAEECALLGSLASAAGVELRSSAVREPTMGNDPRKGRLRLPLRTNFDAAVRSRCDALLMQQISFVRAAHPSLLAALFGSECLCEATCMDNEKLIFSEGEPAINVYSKGGSFETHEDKQSLTCLLNVSAADTDYDGGGTAFWEVTSRDDDAPSVVIRPEAGTSLIFGGQVTHAGVAVESGERVVLVASFSPVAFRYRRAFEKELTEFALTRAGLRRAGSGNT